MNEEKAAPFRKLLKEAPFYCSCRQGASLLCTLDGLRINTQMQVLDKNGNVIEGLYAAGDCSGGFFAHNYPEYIVGWLPAGLLQKVIFSVICWHRNKYLQKE